MINSLKINSATFLKLHNVSGFVNVSRLNISKKINFDAITNIMKNNKQFFSLHVIDDISYIVSSGRIVLLFNALNGRALYKSGFAGMS